MAIRGRKFIGEPAPTLRKQPTGGIGATWRLAYSPNGEHVFNCWFSKTEVLTTLAMGHWDAGMVFEHNGKRYVVGSGEEQRLEEA